MTEPIQCRWLSEMTCTLASELVAAHGGSGPIRTTVPACTNCQKLIVGPTSSNPGLIVLMLAIHQTSEKPIVEALEKRLPKTAGKTAVKRKPRVAPHGPGTEIKKLLAQLGIKPKDNCPCNRLAAEMDKLGVDGVRASREKWIDALTDGYHSATWRETGKAVAIAVQLGLPLTLDGLLDEALRRAESRENPAEKSPGKSTPPS